MESVLTVRMDGQKKHDGSVVLQRLGSSPSAAVRQLFDYVIAHDALPFDNEEIRVSPSDLKERIARFDALSISSIDFQTTPSDDELRDARLAEKYGV